jgi:hypothetical protein
MIIFLYQYVINMNICFVLVEVSPNASTVMIIPPVQGFWVQKLQPNYKYYFTACNLVLFVIYQDSNYSRNSYVNCTVVFLCLLIFVKIN